MAAAGPEQQPGGCRRAGSLPEWLELLVAELGRYDLRRRLLRIGSDAGGAVRKQSWKPSCSACRGSTMTLARADLLWLKRVTSARMLHLVFSPSVLIS